MNDNVFVIFGDSISYGLYDKECCGWVNRLRIKLESLADNNYVVNLGIPGQNSFDIRKRFEYELENRYNDSDNFILIFAFGIKDAAILRNNLEHMNVFKDNVEYIIDMSKKYTSNIYFVGLLEPDYSRRTEYDKKYVDEIDNALENICQENKIEYINVRDLIPVDELIDGLHPNNIGHEKISTVILEKSM